MTAIEKIKAEIERLMDEYEPITGSDELTGAHIALAKLYSFLDTLEEPVSEDLEKAAEKYTDKRLEYANKELADSGYRRSIKMEIRVFSGSDVEDAFKAGAEWQKAKMMDEWLKDRDGCFLDGVNEGKKAMEAQMMGGAYEEEVQELYQDDDGIHCCVSVGTDYKPGTIVYVIIIVKEEEQ